MPGMYYHGFRISLIKTLPFPFLPIAHSNEAEKKEENNPMSLVTWLIDITTLQQHILF